MRDYELVSILSPGLEDAEIQESIQKITTVVQSKDGTVENVRTSEIRRLAYPIKKRTEGIYVVINFRGASVIVSELDRVMKLDDRVLRHRVLTGRAIPPLAQVPAEQSAGEGSDQTEAEPEAVEEPASEGVPEAAVTDDPSAGASEAEASQAV